MFHTYPLSSFISLLLFLKTKPVCSFNTVFSHLPLYYSCIFSYTFFIPTSFIIISPLLCVLCLVTQSCPTLCNPMDCGLPGSSVHGDSPGKNTGWGCHAFLQGIFPTQGSNPGLPHCRQILYCLSHQPEAQEYWSGVAYPVSRGPSQPTNQTRVSCFAGGFFTIGQFIYIIILNNSEVILLILIFHLYRIVVGICTK